MSNQEIQVNPRLQHANLEPIYNFLYETYFEKSNIKKKPFIWFEEKIITKFGQKKCPSLFLGKLFESSSKIKEKCYLTKLTSKRVISTRNLLFVPKIR